MEKVSQISVIYGEHLITVVLQPAKLYLAVTSHKIYSEDHNNKSAYMPGNA